VALDIKVARARLEDLLRLAVKGRPPIAGRAEITTKFLLPAGSGSVADRLQLDGGSTLPRRDSPMSTCRRRSRCSASEGAATIRATAAARVSSRTCAGQFVLRNGQISFSKLAFAVPGAEVHLTGWYSLRGELMDFSGELLTDASLADMTHGFKSLVARVAQPFFRGRAADRGSRFGSPGRDRTRRSGSM
jgi:hypothetical protein